MQVADASAPPTGMAAEGNAMTDGEIRKVDREAGKITIRHGEIRNLDMPAMTMVFRVGDPAMLDQVKPGDRVRFHAEDVAGVLVVTALVPAT
ncbi:MAG TPA: copper-binding protein [Casimicrobiaceae bacterium]|nr:copper-binding protein [Casimicrobiaceae bacterium]